MTVSQTRQRIRQLRAQQDAHLGMVAQLQGMIDTLMLEVPSYRPYSNMTTMQALELLTDAHTARNGSDLRVWSNVTEKLGEQGVRYCHAWKLVRGLCRGTK